MKPDEMLQGKSIQSYNSAFGGFFQNMRGRLYAGTGSMKTPCALENRRLADAMGQHGKPLGGIA